MWKIKSPGIAIRAVKEQNTLGGSAITTSVNARKLTKKVQYW